MATIDMQQSILSQVAGSEQLQQEEVQLTELLPVTQSRIRENGIFKDTDENADETDALKILRSFTSVDNCDNDDEHELCARNLSFVQRRIEQGGQERQDGGKQGRKGKISKRIQEYDKYGNDDVILEEKEENNQKLKGGRRIEKRKKRVDKKSMINRGPKRKRTAGNVIDNNRGEEDERDANAKCRRRIENEFLQDEKESYLSDYNEQVDSSAYLDNDKNSHLNDEIYVFRRELDGDQRQRSASLEDAEGTYRNGNYPKTTDGALFDRMAISSEAAIESDEGEKRLTDVDLAKGCMFDSRVANSTSLFNFAKESKTNIVGTGMSYLVENENNNSVGSNRLKVEENGTNSLFGSEVSANIAVVVESSSSSLSSSCSRKENVSGSEDGREEDEGIDAKQENQQKKYCCVVCEARFKGSGGLRNHYKIVHGAGPIFKCDECGKEFPLKERLKLHVRTHTGFKPYKCPECDKSFARGGQLVQHRRTHSQVKPYRCGLCSGTFTCAANLALHVKRHNGQKDHKCEICGRAFVRRDALKKHLECLHRDVKSFLCVICNKTFKGHLPQHMRTHARDRPHGCATCGQRFAQKSQLTVHQRTHSGQRPFRCLVCWQAFAHSTALKLHTRRHTGERPFKCAECNAGFTQLPHWKKHMKCIHGRNEPYACKKCKSFFRIKNDLECHEKTCHPELGNELEVSGIRNANSMAATATPISPTLQSTTPLLSNETVADKPAPPTSKYRVMTVERMRLLLAVLLKRISKQERLDELGFGKRLIDEVLHDSLISAGKDPVASDGLSELETLTKNLEIFLKWTVPKEHWENFRRLNKSPEDILETLTAT